MGMLLEIRNDQDAGPVKLDANVVAKIICCIILILIKQAGYDFIAVT